MQPARELEVLSLQLGLLDPRLQDFPCRRGDLNLDRSLGLVLHDDGARCELNAVADVADPQGNEVATPELAVDAQVEERQLAHAVLHLESHPKCPDVLELEWSFCPTILPLFQGSRWTALATDPMMGSHRVKGSTRCAGHRVQALPCVNQQPSRPTRVSGYRWSRLLTLPAIERHSPEHWRAASQGFSVELHTAVRTCPQLLSRSHLGQAPPWRAPCRRPAHVVHERSRGGRASLHPGLL